MLDLKLCKLYLGITITQDCKNQIMRIGQLAYLKKILLDHQIMYYKPAPTPIKTPYLKVASKDYQPEEQYCTRYQAVVRSLMYSMLKIRPDPAFAVPVVSRFPSRPNYSHWQLVEQIFCYDKETLDL